MKIPELLAACEATKAEPSRYSVAVQYRRIEAERKYFPAALRCLAEVRQFAKLSADNLYPSAKILQTIERFDAGEFADGK